MIVGALGFASFLCIRELPPHVAVITSVTAVATLALVVVVPRGVVEVVGLLRELVQIRGELLDRRVRADESDADQQGDEK